MPPVIFTCAKVETRHFVVGVERAVEILVPGRVNCFNRFKCIELDPKLRGAADNNIGSLHSLQKSMIDADNLANTVHNQSKQEQGQLTRLQSL